jgi:hypothetical protein
VPFNGRILAKVVGMERFKEIAQGAHGENGTGRGEAGNRQFMKKRADIHQRVFDSNARSRCRS